MTAQIITLPTRPAIRCIDEAPSVRAHAEALMRMLVKDKRNCRAELGLIADLMDPMLERMEGDRG